MPLIPCDTTVYRRLIFDVSLLFGSLTTFRTFFASAFAFAFALAFAFASTFAACYCFFIPDKTTF